MQTAARVLQVFVHRVLFNSELVADHRAGRLGALSIPLRALFGRLERYEQFESTSATQITMSLRHPRVPAGIDGEVLELESPLRFVVRPRALQVMLPRS